jgi:hypothetical protein
VAGLSSSCSQKIFNMVAAVRQACPLFASVHSHVHPLTLQHLGAPSLYMNMLR